MLCRSVQCYASYHNQVYRHNRSNDSLDNPCQVHHHHHSHRLHQFRYRLPQSHHHHHQSFRFDPRYHLFEEALGIFLLRIFFSISATFFAAESISNSSASASCRFLNSFVICYLPSWFSIVLQPAFTLALCVLLLEDIAALLR